MRGAEGSSWAAVEFASPSCFLACVAWRHISMRALQPVHGLRRQRGSFKRRLAKPATSSKNARYASRFGPYSCSVTKRHCSRDSFGPTKLSRRKRDAAARCKPLFSSITKNICCSAGSPTVNNTEPETPSRRAIVRRIEPSRLLLDTGRPRLLKSSPVAVSGSCG